MFLPEFATLLCSYATKMENSGVVFMLKNERISDLSCMFKLFGRVESGHQVMVGCMSKHLRELGTALVKEDEGEASSGGKNAITFVQVVDRYRF